MIGSTNIILGPPGTGKTTRLLDIMEKEFKSGCQPDRMIFCSFTKKAVEEAVDRVTARFNFTKKDMVHFKTIHSLAFHALGLKREQVMQAKDYAKIGEHLGITFSNKMDFAADVQYGSKAVGDQYNFLHGFSRARHLPLKTVWDMIDHDNLNWFEFLRYQDTLVMYKRDRNLFDFADMLEQGICALDVDVVIIDEAQDLSTAQWHFIKQITSRAKRIYVGGDDDQAIFSWSGADVNHFLTMPGQREVLQQSYRVPKAVHAIAAQLTGKIHTRADKQYAPVDKVGTVEYWNSVDHLDLTSGTWLILARNSHLIPQLSASVREKGISYAIRGKSVLGQDHVRAIKMWEQWRKGKVLDETDTDLINSFLARGCTVWPKEKIWHEAFVNMPLEDKEYYISLLRRNESLTRNPRINISTIHGVKGGEADHVALATDMSFSTWDASGIDPDSEHRVWYVGATRCRESLNIILPKGRYSYSL